MGAIVLDIDDTLINPSRRMQAIWHEVLGSEVPLEAVESLGQEQILMTYLSKEQRIFATEFQRRFWDLVLCLEEFGVKLLELDEPLPSAAEVVQGWSRDSDVLYVTGRTENTRKLTSDELEGFGFPMENARLFMLQVDDYARMRGESPTGPTLTEAKSQLFAAVATKQKVARVVDDVPDYFQVYKQFEVPERIGFHIKRFSSVEYLKKGATRVIESWNDLKATKGHAVP